MEHIANFIVNQRKLIIVVFVVLSLVCAPLLLLINVNYNIIDYLPQSSQSTVALTVMDKEFDDAVPNTKVMINDVSLPEALEYKKEIVKIQGVSSVLWLDDVVDITKPLEFADKAMVEQYYKDGTALFTLAIRGGDEHEAITALQDLVGPDNAVGGESASLTAMQDAAVSEVLGAFYIIIPAIIIILALSTSSWLEPLLLLLSIGVAIVLNMGTNALLKDVSFITSSVSPILQLAVSLDYAIFLLHSFADYRKQYKDPNVAMKHAIMTSFSTVSSSAITSLFGFIALAFMGFLVGADLGINLAKGIIFSFLSAMLFLPSVTLGVYKLLERTKHRPLLPSFENIHRYISKAAIPLAVVVILIVVPSFLGQSRTDFLYGSDSAGAGTRAQADNARIDEKFGESNLVVMLVPRGDVVTEKQLGDSLLKLDHVTSVVSYAQVVGVEVPPEILDAAITGQLYSNNYARFLVYVDLPSEGDLTFSTIEKIRAVASEYYGDAAYSLGRSANLYDMKDVVHSDNLRVNIIAVVSIFLVLVLVFRSLMLPLILTLTIEAAIWINLAIPYFAGIPINYIGYLVLNVVQLVATVDYAILLTNTYRRYRKTMLKGEAVSRALGTTFKSIIVSASILSICGFALYYTSTNPIVCDIGVMLGRGTLLSFVLVVCVLPLMLRVFDPLIKKLTWKSGFLNKTAEVTSS